MTDKTFDNRYIESVQKEIPLSEQEIDRYKKWTEYLMSVKKGVDNQLYDSQRTGMMVGGCSDISTFLTSTNCETAICLDRRKLIIKKDTENRNDDILKTYLKDKIKGTKWGYTSGALLHDSAEWGNILLWELKAIKAVDIEYQSNEGFICQIDFDWSYFNEDSKHRKLYFLCKDVYETKNYDYKLEDLFPKGIDIYFEKAHGDIFGFMDDKSVKSLLVKHLKPNGLVVASNCKQGFVPWKSFDGILNKYNMFLTSFIDDQGGWKSKEDLLIDLMIPDHFCVDGRTPEKFWEGTPEGFLPIKDRLDLTALEDNLKTNDFGYGLVFNLWQKSNQTDSPEIH